MSETTSLEDQAKLGTRGDPRLWKITGHNKFWLCFECGQYPNDEKEHEKMGREGSAIEFLNIPTDRIDYVKEKLKAERPTWEIDIELM